MDEILEVLKGIVPPIITAVVSWFLAKRKYNAEVENSLIVNMSSSLDFYKQMVDDNKVRLAEGEEENRRLRDEIKSQAEEIRELREQVNYLMRFLCTKLVCENRERKGLKTQNKANRDIKSDNK